MNQMTKRVCMSLFGVIVCGACVGIFKIAALGIDPFQAFMAGLDQLIPISFGTLYMIANAILLIFSLVVDRHNIGIATFINLFLLGYITQFSYAFLQTIIVNPSIVTRFICLIVAVVILCFSSSFYMTADLGVSTYDAIAIVMSGKWHMGPFKYIRICTDVICIVIGIALFLLGGGKIASVPTFVGVGTIITAFFMGPLIDFFSRKVARPFLEGKKS